MKKEIYISKGVGETRIAVKENGKLAELHVDNQSQVKTVGNIYKGVVENVIPGMQAAFVNIGQDVNAFLPFSEISDSELIAEKNNKTQLRIAETEKYPHVTFFFSGGREKPFNFEKRILKDSPKVATYDMKPEMSAYEITEELILEIENKTNDFICLNYANGDMVGHTGSFEAAVKACETIDECDKKVIKSCIKTDYTVLLISDHGNCDMMMNEDGSPNTAHTKNLVPLILINSEYKSISDGILADIAPTILKIMNIEIPSEMTQNPLV